MAILYCGKTIQPLQSFHFHAHKGWEIILNLEGYGDNLFENGESYPFAPGSVICIPPGLQHSKSSKATFKDIHFVCSDFMADETPEVLVFQDDEDKTIETLMHLVHNTYHKKEANHTHTVRALIDALSNVLIGKREMPTRNPAIKRVIHLMVENFSDPEFTVSHALSSQAYCADYLRRVFKKETSMTPGAYLNRLRITQAKMQLRQKSDSDTTIGDIAVMCGFYDARYFSRLFKQHTGLTPLEYANGNGKTNE